MWYFIVAILFMSSCFLYVFLKHHSRMIANMMDEGNRRRDMLRMIDSLKHQPQSGFWVKCRTHGDVPLTKAEHERQDKISKCCCPICGAIPQKIWKR